VFVVVTYYVLLQFTYLHHKEEDHLREEDRLKAEDDI
jgi:hypothetical protein